MIDIIKITTCVEDIQASNVAGCYARLSNYWGIFRITLGAFLYTPSPKGVNKKATSLAYTPCGQRQSG